MGSGLNFFTNGIDVTPGSTGSWVDVDVRRHTKTYGFTPKMRIYDRGDAPVTYILGVKGKGRRKIKGAYVFIGEDGTIEMSTDFNYK